MRNLEDIKRDLNAAREALSSVEGTPAEVYSRIVGYYRSVRNWNRGKREEYGERRLYRISNSLRTAAPFPANITASINTAAAQTTTGFNAHIPLHIAEQTAAQAVAHNAAMRLLLFVRTSCPGCDPAKAAARRLGIPVDLVNADTSEGKAEAFRRRVLSTPVAILLSPGGEELKRATDPDTISSLQTVFAANFPAQVSAAD